MNVTLQAHGERTLYPLPPGLSELVHDITREVLRRQPTDLYGFIADYLESLLRIRNSLNVSVRVRGGIVRECEDFLNHLLVCGFSHGELASAATTIQRVWRGVLARHMLREVEKCRRQKEEQYGVEMAELAEELNATLDEMVQAVLLIQEMFRRFLDSHLEGEEAEDENGWSRSSELDHELTHWMTDELQKAISPDTRESALLLENLSENEADENLHDGEMDNDDDGNIDDVKEEDVKEDDVKEEDVKEDVEEEDAAALDETEK